MWPIEITTPRALPAIPTAPGPDGGFFPDFDAAWERVFNHVATLGSDETKKQHTRVQYRAILDNFIQWLGQRYPTEAVIEEWMAHEKGRGVKPATVNKYLAPVKLFCQALAKQPINPYTLSENNRFALSEIRQQVSNVATLKGLKTPPSNEAGIDRHTWLTDTESRDLLAKLAKQKHTLPGHRDYIIFLVALNTGLRLQELTDLTLASFSLATNETAKITIRRKGGKTNPVPCPVHVYRAVREWYDRYNDLLAKTDPRRLTPTSSLWPPFTRTGNIFSLAGWPRQGDGHPYPGLGSSAVAEVIRRRSAKAGHPINPHDTRRTYAASIRKAGVDLDKAALMTGHEDLNTLKIYLGAERDWDTLNLAVITGDPLQ